MSADQPPLANSADHQRMLEIDRQLSHVWMVRTFVKHAPETEDDDELAEVHRALYDYMLALGAPLKAADAAGYLKMARKKWARLRQAAEQFAALQPEISTHTNFQMAVASLQAAVAQIDRLLHDATTDAGNPTVVPSSDLPTAGDGP